MITQQQLVTFNPEQLCTWNEAKQVIAKKVQTPFNGRVIGGGLVPLTDDYTTSGIYLGTAPWNRLGGPEPAIGKAKSYCFRFKNGFAGMNCGLVRGMFERYPNSPLYVLSQLCMEVEGVNK
jgi:hypothetical protein